MRKWTVLVNRSQSSSRLVDKECRPLGPVFKNGLGEFVWTLIGVIYPYIN